MAMLVGVVPAAAAQSGTNEPSVSEAREAAVAEAIAQGEAIAAKRLQELRAAGLSDEEAAEQLRAEQNQRAEVMTRRVNDLSAQGLTPQEIAEETGLVFGGTVEDSGGIRPLSTNDDVDLYDLSWWRDPQSETDIVSADWQQLDDLENGVDATAFLFEEEVDVVTGWVQVCDAYQDECQNDSSSIDMEDPHGALDNWTSEEGESGYMTLTVRDWSDDGGVRCKVYFGYSHAWETGRLTGFGVGYPFSITFSWKYEDHSWETNIGGLGSSCGSN